MTGDAAAKANKLKDLLIELSPLIEEYSSRVCPGCTDVCCKQKRSYPEHVDARYIEALAVSPPLPDPARSLEGPCQFMGREGCLTPRWLRPWRCTWYFCDPLLEAMQRGPQRKSRKISNLIQKIVDIRSDF